MDDLPAQVVDVGSPSTRSLGWTIVTALLTYALLVSTSWKMGVLHSPHSVHYTGRAAMAWRLHWHAINTFLMPYRALQEIFTQATALMAVRGSYIGKGMPLFPGLDVPMAHLILSSTLIIEVPASQDPGPHLRPYRVPANTIAALRPLHISPVDGLGLLLNSATDPVDAPPSQPPAETLEEEKLYLRLPPPDSLKALQEREMLLTCGFAVLEQHSEVCSMDAKSSFSRVQAAAVVLQAGGYMLDVVERWRQGLGVSPVEAIVWTFSLPILMQVLAVPATASHSYDRPLLLRLRPLQFVLYRDMPRGSEMTQGPDSHISQILLLLTYHACARLIIPIISVCYCSHYRRLGLSSSFAALMLFLLSSYPFVARRFISRAFPKTTFAQDLQALYTGGLDTEVLIRANATSLLILVAGQICLFFVTVALAFSATIKHWSAFNNPTNPRLAWLVPHFAS